MEHSNNRYPRLLALTAHELRTPTSVVTGYLRMLQKDGDPPMTDRQRRMIDEAEKSCARLVAIASELSEIERLDSGTTKLAQQPLDLFSLIGDVAGHVAEAADRDVHLRLSGPSDGAIVTGDNMRLRAAFDAIFRAMLRDQPGPTTVMADRRHGTRDGRPCALLIVADAAHVQEACDREEAPFDDARGGMGLALPLARRVIEGLGGSLWSPAAAPAGGDDQRALGSVLIALPIADAR